MKNFSALADFFPLLAILSFISTARCALPVTRSNDHVELDDAAIDAMFSYCPPEGTGGPLLGFKQSMIFRPQEPQTKDHVFKAMRQSWLPAYPGSGSGLMGTLVKNSTGFNRTNQGDYCKHDNCIICKTHYPAVGHLSPSDIEPEVEVPFNEFYFMLLRNPAGAIPSYFNQIFEMQNHLGTHTEQAPIEAWKEWRDRDFMEMLHLWTHMIKFWDATPYKLAMYVPYEEMTDPLKGPALFRELLDNLWLLHEDGNQKEIKSSEQEDRDVDCLWKTYVIDHAKMKRERSYEPGFTEEQKGHMLHALSDLIEWALNKLDVENEASATSRKSALRLVGVLEGYRTSIIDELIVDDE